MRNINQITNRFVFFCIIYTIILFNLSESQAFADKGINITGTLFNAQTREPIQTTIVFIDETGTELKSKSGINGQYQAQLVLGRKYSVAVENNVIINSDEDFVVIPKNTTSEVRKNFELSKIMPGIELLTFNAFGANKEVLNADALTHILKLKSFLEMNNNVKIKIYISGEDTYITDKPTNDDKKKSESKKSKKDKKSNKKKNLDDDSETLANTKLSAKERLDLLIDKRASNLKDIFTSLRIFERRYSIEKIAVSAEKPIPAVTKSKKTKKSSKADTPEIVDDGMKLITLKVEVESILK